jgi:hypothetical protein
MPDPGNPLKWNSSRGKHASADWAAHETKG